MVLASVVIGVLLAGCDSGGASAPTPPAGTPGVTQGDTGAKLNVVVTTTQIRSMTEAVAGDLADVRSISRRAPTRTSSSRRPSDVTAISTATLVLKNGVGLTWIG